MRFRLVELFSFVFVLAFGLGALLRSGSLLAPLFFSSTLCVLLAAVLCAVARHGEARFFWIGFAVSGIGYLWCVTSPDSEPFVFETTDAFVTSRVLQSIWDSTHPDQVPGGMGRGMMSVRSEGSAESAPKNGATTDDPFGADAAQPTNGLSLVLGSGQTVLSDDLYAFLRAGHCLWAILIAWVGGYFTQWVYRASRTSSR